MRQADRDRLTRLRLDSQWISGGPDERTVTDVVQHLTALQAQDLPGAKWAVALRTADARLADVDEALESGTIVRSWPFRGTLHFVPAEDLGWMLDLTAARTVSAAAARHRALGLGVPEFDAARRIAESSLGGGRALGRDQLFADFQAGGISTDGQRGVHLLWFLAHTKVICFGPMLGKNQALVLLDEWVASPRSVETDESLGELALRYFRSHGPATVKDFRWWSKLLAKESAIGLELARIDLESIELEGETYWLAAGAQDAAASRRARASVDLLPGFDEFILGYTDRSAPLDAGHFERIVPGGNGMFLPTIVAGGRVVGTWTRRQAAKNVKVALDPFAELSAAQHKRAHTAAKRYAAYLGLPLAP